MFTNTVLSWLHASFKIDLLPALLTQTRVTYLYGMPEVYKQQLAPLMLKQELPTFVAFLLQ